MKMRRILLQLVVFAVLSCVGARGAGLSPRAALEALNRPRFTPIAEKPAPEDTRLPLSAIRDWLDQYPETGITFLEYMCSNPVRPTPRRHAIHLVPMGDFSDHASLRKLAGFLSAFYMLPVRVRPAIPLRAEPDPRRGFRYDADEMILNIKSATRPDAMLTVGITRHDLYSGRLNGVYGIGYADLHTCVISTRRIWQDGSAAGPHEFLRLCKLTAHEIGHALGLPHCAAYRCRMNSTSGLRSIDQSPLCFCGPCLRKIQWNIGFDKRDRADALYAVAREERWTDVIDELKPRLARLHMEAPGGDGEALFAARSEEE
jgi:archaemetzincin